MNKMFKRLIAPVLGLTVLMAGNASAITIGFSQIGQESDWRTANTDSVCSAIEGHEGWELVYSDGQQKQENQIQALNNFITQGVDYILFTGVVTSGWDEILAEVNENEIPLILLDRIPDCADKIDYVAAFGGDFPLEGRRQVQWAGEYLKSLGRDSETVNVAIMEGTTGADAQVGRTEGNLAALEDYPFMEVVAQQTGNFTRAEGQALMETWLKSVDKIDVLIAQNDDNIIIVGCDSVKAAFEAIVAGEMNATIECNPLYGEFVVSAIEALEAGETFDKEIIHPEEGVYDCVGGIEVEGTTSVLASDVIDERLY